MTTARKMSPRVWLLLCAFALMLCLRAAAEGESTVPQVALLRPKRKGADQQDAWGVVLRELLATRLRRAARVRLSPETSIAWATSLSQEDRATNFGDSEAHRIGEVLAADHVIWGEYSVAHGRWTLTLHNLVTKNGPTSHPVLTTATNCDLLVALAASQVARHLGNENIQDAQPTAEIPDEALELTGEAFALSRAHGSVTEQAAKLQRAVQLAPHSALLRQALAQALIANGDTLSARQESKRALDLDPHYSRAVTTLGLTYLLDKMPHLAREQFEKAAVLDPEDPENFIRLGEILGQEGRCQQAGKLFEKARALAPFSPIVHVRAAETYNCLSQKEAALAELKLAEACDLSLDCENARLIAGAYDTFTDFPKAVEFYRRFLSCAEQVGLQSPNVKGSAERLHELQMRLTEHLLKMPDDWPTNSSASTATSSGPTSKLFACSDQMKQWVSRVTSGSSDPLQRARSLFAAIVRPVGRRSDPGITASRAFDELARPTGNLSCHGFALLYIALGRRIGLDVNYVAVERDYTSQPVYHACAALRLGQQILLVDPLYQWFGVPHREFRVLSDSYAAAEFLASSDDPKQQDVALALAPEWSMVHFWVAIARARRGDQPLAEKELSQGLKRDSTAWYSFYASAYVSRCRHDWTATAISARECVTKNPTWSAAWNLLAEALEHLGDTRGAQDSYSKSMERADNANDLAWASENLSRLKALDANHAR